LPGGEATISRPLSAWFSWSVTRRKACPPWNSPANTWAKFSLILAKASSNLVREI